MEDRDDKINQLLQKHDALLKRQESFSREIQALRDEILSLRSSSPQDIIGATNEKLNESTTSDLVLDTNNVTVPPIPSIPREKLYGDQPVAPVVKSITPPRIRPVTEKYIGENLINKIGIGITIIGVGIGAKYSIDHDLISPLTRIILGYLVGLGLLGFGIRLKKNFENFSAVLVSGAIAIMYFITYAAYSFYNLFSLVIAFSLMVVFTLFTVYTAIKYNKQVIALIGLVGAYAVPFLLSEGPGNEKVLFSYMAIINVGILAIALRKYWKPLYYSSFLLTWLIYLFWYTSSYEPVDHFRIASIFLCVFFLTFYFIFLAYKITRREKFEISDIFLLLTNSFIFYGVGYAMLNTYSNFDHALGLFTVCNALIHFVISVFIYQQKLADRNLFFLVIGLALIFITIAIPVQLDGNWVTLLWVGEATLLFWIGRNKGVPLYEKLSYPLIALAFISIIQDWMTHYHVYDPDLSAGKLTPILNVYFLTSLLFSGCFAMMTYWDRRSGNEGDAVLQKNNHSLVHFSITVILVIVLYGSMAMEISNYFRQLYQDSEKLINNETMGYSDHVWNDDWLYYKIVWLINYSLLFFSGLTYVMLGIQKQQNLHILFLLLNSFVLLLFLTFGLFFLSELRDSYLDQVLAEYYHRNSFNIGIRYISYGLAALNVYSIYQSILQGNRKPDSASLQVVFDYILHVTIIWVVTSELVTWMNILEFSYSYKLGLSILWGVYSLILIGLGIWKGKKHLRIGAIALFTITLVKLFFYDISLLGTIAKTIVFVVLGILLLIISFLYNKYKDTIR